MMESLCRRCFTHIAFQSRRNFASIATAAAETTAIPSSIDPVELPVLEEEEAPPSYDDFLPDYKRPVSDFKLAASTVLSRAPVLTRDLTTFEEEFFFYQRRLDKRLVKPFTRNFYFKPGTLAYDEWRGKRLGMKVYNPYGKDGWKDELRYGDKPLDDENMDYDALVNYTVSGEDISASDTEEEIAAKKLMTKPLPRETEADLKNDTRSLNRKLSRTLYLLVKRGDRNDNTWKFPQADIEGRENLKQTAEGILTKACGRDMNYWMVGNVPIGHYTYYYPDGYAAKEGDAKGKKVFFMKSRIFAGRPKLMGNTVNLTDYQWLTKEEIEGVVEKDYWKAIKRILVTR